MVLAQEPATGLKQGLQVLQKLSRVPAGRVRNGNVGCTGEYVQLSIEKPVGHGQAETT